MTIHKKIGYYWLTSLKCWLGFHKRSTFWNDIHLEWCDTALWEFTECGKCGKLITMKKFENN